MMREQLIKDCRKAIERLISHAHELYTTTISNDCVFIKCYPYESVYNTTMQNFFFESNKYDLKRILKNDICSLDCIIKDIEHYVTSGRYVRWVDFTIFYATPNVTFIKASLFFCDNNVQPEVIIHWPVIYDLEDKNGEKKHDLNEHLIPPALRLQGYTVQGLIDSVKVE